MRSMYTRQNNRLKQAIALGLSAAMLCPPATSLVAAAYAQGVPPSASAPTGIRSVLLFPFTNNAGASADSLAARLTDAVKLRINTVGSYSATAFTTFLPPVQRAIDDNVLPKEALTPPFDSSAKAGPIAQQVETDGYLIGSIESYSTDAASKKVTIEVSATLYNTANNTATKTLAFTGSAAPISTGEDESAVTQAAIDDAAGKIVNGLGTSTTTQRPVVMASSQRGSNKTGQTALLVILGAALVYAVFHNSGSGGGGGGSSATTGSTSSGGGGGPTGPPAPPSVK